MTTVCVYVSAYEVSLVSKLDFFFSIKNLPTYIETFSSSFSTYLKTQLKIQGKKMAVNSSNTLKNHYLPILCHRMHLKNKQTKKKAFSLSPAYGFIWVISVWGTVEYPGVDVKDESCLFRALGLFSAFFSATEVPENKQPVRSPPTCPFLRC